MIYTRPDFTIRDFNMRICVAIENHSHLMEFQRQLSTESDMLRQNGLEIVICFWSKELKDDLILIVSEVLFLNVEVIEFEKKPFNVRDILYTCASYSKKKYFVFFHGTPNLSQFSLLESNFLIHNYDSHFITAYAFTAKDLKKCEKVIIAIIVKKEDLMKALRTFEPNPDTNRFLWQIRDRLEFFGLLQLEVTCFRDCNFPLSNQPMSLRPEPCNYDITLQSLDCSSFYIIHTYRKNQFALRQLSRHLQTFDKYEITFKNIERGGLRIVALVQTYNEKEFINGLLDQLDMLCDGIIVMDDGSIDGTYELIQAKRLLLKCQKSKVGKFNDLSNRNALLKIASLINSDYFFFIDADERFDRRYCDLYSVITTHPDADAFTFYVANLWDTENSFLVPLKRNIKNFDAKNDLWKRVRMFKNKGYSQIISEGKYSLHFTCSPFFEKLIISNLMILHYGTLTLTARQNKYEFYKVNDPDWKQRSESDYDYLKETGITLPVSSINLL